MEYVVNLMDVTVKPSEWARQREDEGWHVLSVADHFYTDHRPFPHIWVCLLYTSPSPRDVEESRMPSAA